MNAATALVPANRLSRLLAAALLAVCAGVAQAQDFYKCVTPNGRRLGADRPPPECAGAPIEHYGPDGRHKGTINPPLTAEQRRRLDEAARRQRDEEEAKRDQRQRDRSLLATYRSLEEIEAARQRALRDRQVIIDRALKRFQELKRDRKKLDDETEFFTKRDLPEKLKRALAANNESVKAQERIIADVKADMKRVNERFDAEARRFRELMERGSRPARSPSDSK